MKFTHAGVHNYLILECETLILRYGKSPLPAAFVPQVCCDAQAAATGRLL
jgi:hypothetical protein